MSELSEAMALAAALPEIQRKEIDRLVAVLKRIPVSHVSQAADAIEQFGDLTRETLMKVRNEHVRVAVWYVDSEHRCQHKAYNVGNVRKATIGNIGDAEWYEAWIA